MSVRALLTTLFVVLLHARPSLSLCLRPEEDCAWINDYETSECQSTHMFMARGSTSPYPGHLAELMRLICDGVEGTCGFENIVYPASNAKGQWCNSAKEGTLNGQAQLRNYTERCPDSKMVVLGFSQGGSVVWDMLGGGGGVHVMGCDQEIVEGLDANTIPGSKIAAAVSWGPTVRSAHQNFTVKGGDRFDGIAARTNSSLEGLHAFGDRIREYCQPRDPICAPSSGKTDMSKHLDYFDQWNQEAADWVLKLVQPPTTPSTNNTGNDANSEGPAGGFHESSAKALKALHADSWYTVVLKALYLGVVLFVLVFLLKRVMRWRATRNYNLLKSTSEV